MSKHRYFLNAPIFTRRRKSHLIKIIEPMIPKTGCNVSNLSQLVPVKTGIPLKTHIIEQYAPVYIQQTQI